MRVGRSHYYYFCKHGVVLLRTFGKVTVLIINFKDQIQTGVCVCVRETFKTEKNS